MAKTREDVIITSSALVSSDLEGNIPADGGDGDVVAGSASVLGASPSAEDTPVGSDVGIEYRYCLISWYFKSVLVYLTS